MPIIKQTILACDICGRYSTASESPKPEGWVQWSQDHPIEERQWIERCACPYCINDIMNAAQKGVIKTPVKL